VPNEVPPSHHNSKMAFTYYRASSERIAERIAEQSAEIDAELNNELAGTPPEHMHLSQPYPRQNAIRADASIPLPTVSPTPLPASTPLASPQLFGATLAAASSSDVVWWPPLNPPLTINTSQPLGGPAIGGGEATPPGRISIPRLSAAPAHRQETWSIAYGNPPPWMREAGDYTPGPAIGGGEATPPSFYEMHPELRNRPAPRY
jgi:hypothetical protein